MRLIITTIVDDPKEITEWYSREGILTGLQKEELLSNGKVELKRTNGSITTYKLVKEKVEGE